MNSPESRTSSAHKPKPFRSKPSSILSIIALVSSGVRGAGKYSITSGSAFIAANGARSSSRHRRIRSRCVRTPTTLSDPDGDVGTALGGERLPGPVGPPLFQAHPGQLSHEVQFGRPHVPVLRMECGRLAILDEVMVGDQPLVQQIVRIDADP